jgi:hypothetical protein
VGTIQFPIQKCAIFRKIKETGNPLQRSGPAQCEAAAKKSKDYAEAYMLYTAQVFLQIDADIAKLGTRPYEVGVQA